MKITAIAPLSLLFLLSMGPLALAQTSGSDSPSMRPAPPAPRPAPTAPPSSPGGTPAPAPTGAPASAPAPSDAHAANTSPDYRLVPGDKLRVEVYRDAQLSQSLQVRPDGKITMPLIGDLVAAGRTSAELRDSLIASLKEYNTNPLVTVIVVETVPPVFYVMGEVNTPGTFPIKGQVSAVQALAMAGGFKDFAKTKNIKILRKNAQGAQENVKFNYKDAADGKGAQVYMQPGDTIIVP